VHELLPFFTLLSDTREKDTYTIVFAHDQYMSVSMAILDPCIVHKNSNSFDVTLHDDSHIWLIGLTYSVATRRGFGNFLELTRFSIHSHRDIQVMCIYILTLITHTHIQPNPHNTPPQDGAKISMSPILLQMLPKDTTLIPLVKISAN
jgi:hypothetical protein